MGKCRECGLDEARVKFCSNRCASLWHSRDWGRRHRWESRVNKYLVGISYSMYKDEPKTLIGDKQITHA